MRRGIVLGIVAGALAGTLLGGLALASRSAAPTDDAAQVAWGEPISWPGVTTTYGVYRQNFVYGKEPFLVTDMRTEDPYAEKESYEMRSLTIYRAHDGRSLLEQQPVVFFVHGGAWTDGYEDWYDFVSRSFTGEKGWVTVVIDYRLTSNQIFLADAHCPNRVVCGQPIHAAQRTKAAWYPDNIQDVAAALRWVSGHIEEHGGDSQRIVAFGHSAGGHLATLLATHPDYADLRPMIRALISMSGAYSLPEVSMITFGNDIDQTFQGGHLHNEAELSEASPGAYVQAGMAFPPAYLLHAQLELPSLITQMVTFQGQLATAGLSVQGDILPGYDHMTEMEAIGDIQALPTRLIVDFIEKTLHLNARRYGYLPWLVRAQPTH